jgi:HSP20 family protein
MAENLPVRSHGAQPGTVRSRSLFGDLFGFDPFRMPYASFGDLSKAFGLEVSRSDDGYTIEFPVAGFKPEEIEVTVQDDNLMISGKNERRSFTRSLTLAEEIDPDEIAAHVDHGMLTLRLKQRPEAKPRRIAVQAGASGAIPTVSGTTEERSPAKTGAAG